jgi:hypothetical protein
MTEVFILKKQPFGTARSQPGGDAGGSRSVEDASEATQRALGAGEVDGTTLRQEVSDARGGGRGGSHIEPNGSLILSIPWFVSQPG